MIVTVFGSSRPRPGDPEYDTARQLGNELARSGFGVCTGGYAGTMEAVSCGAAEAGGRVLAVTARVFGRTANQWVAEETAVETWSDRLFKLIELGDAYVALPGALVPSPRSPWFGKCSTSEYSNPAPSCCWANSGARCCNPYKRLKTKDLPGSKPPSA